MRYLAGVLFYSDVEGGAGKAFSEKVSFELKY